MYFLGAVLKYSPALYLPPPVPKALEASVALPGSYPPENHDTPGFPDLDPQDNPLPEALANPPDAANL